MNRRLKESTAMESIRDDDANKNPVNGYTQQFNLCEPSRLKETLKPLILSMRCFGIIYGDMFQALGCDNSNTVVPSDTKNYHLEPVTKSSHHDVEGQAFVKDKRNRWKRFSETLNLCFCIVIALLVFASCIHGTMEVVVARDMLNVMTRIFLLSWIVLCGLQQVVCLFTISYRSKNKPLNKFDKLVKAILLVRAESVSKTKKCVRNTVMIGWIYVVINCTILLTGFHHPDKEIRMGLREISFGKSNWTISNNDALAYAYSFMAPILCGNWAIPTALYISLCLVVGGLFNDLFERASYAILKKKEFNLAELRLEYVRLCNVLSALNDLLAPLGMLMFAVYIPLICLNINVCIQTFNEDSNVSRIAYITWIVGNTLILLFVSINGAQVNNSACRLSEVLYNIDVKELDKKSELELMLLLSNVSTNYAGLTVGGLVTITKEMILTIFGTIIGYLTILIQFK